jgi:hypothetical protein
MSCSSCISERIPLVSPASKDSWKDFLAAATELDDTGFPLRGSFGIHFDCLADLRTAITEEDRSALATTAIRSVRGAAATKNQVSNSVRQVLLAYKELQPGQIVAFKKGTQFVAYARIVSPYRYEETSPFHYPHRWDYVILHKARPDEAKLIAGHIQTYYSKGYTYLPPPVVAPTVVAPAGGAGIASLATEHALALERIAVLEEERAVFLERMAEIERRMGAAVAALTL